MAARSKARKRAVDVLYEADVRGGDRLTLLRERIADGQTAKLGLEEDVQRTFARFGSRAHRGPLVSR